jgi:hypothetical protein
MVGVEFTVVLGRSQCRTRARTHTHGTNMHASSRIRTRNPSNSAALGLVRTFRFRPAGRSLLSTDKVVEHGKALAYSQTRSFGRPGEKTGVCERVYKQHVRHGWLSYQPVPGHGSGYLRVLPGSRPENSRPAKRPGCVTTPMLSCVPLLCPAIIGTCRPVENRKVWTRPDHTATGMAQHIGFGAAVSSYKRTCAAILLVQLSWICVTDITATNVMRSPLWQTAYVFIVYCLLSVLQLHNDWRLRVALWNERAAVRYSWSKLWAMSQQAH